MSMWNPFKTSKIKDFHLGYFNIENKISPEERGVGACLRYTQVG